MRKLSLLALVLGLAACRGDDGGGDDTPGMDADPGKTEYTIQEIQDAAMPACDVANPQTCVSLTIKGVVVTAIDAYGAKTGDIWVEEPGGGAYSGVHVYGAPLDQVAALSIGAVVDITGAVKDEFHYNGSGGSGGFPEGYSITELKPVGGGMMTVTATGETMEITPDVVDALAIGQMSDYMARDAEWEKWEGVLIKLENVQAFSKDDCVGSSCNDDTLRSFSITGDILVESALTAMPDPAVAYGDCFTGVTGVLDYFFDYQILPRTTDEIATGGTSCPTENADAECGDDIDNDGNGFKDCDDNSCVTNAPSCAAATTINAIQTAATPPSGGVKLTDVYVAAVSKNQKNMWVQTNLTAAPNEGLYVYGPGSNLNFTPGQKVNVIGKIDEFNDMSGTETLTELRALSVTAGTAGTGTIVPVTDVAASAMSTESYESTLVTLTNVKVGTVGIPCDPGESPPACNYGVGDLTQYPGATVVKTDDDINIIAPTNTCYASVTGVWQYLPFNNTWGFLPLTAAGTGTGDCTP